MKPMPTEPLPADSLYEYVPEQDEWVVKKKTDKASKLSKKDIVAYEGGYPTEEDSTTWGAAAPGTYAYTPATHDSQTGLREGDTGEPLVLCPKCKSDKINTESNMANCQSCGVNFIPEPDRGSDEANDYSQNYEWGPQDLGRVHQHQPGDSMWEPAGTEDEDGVSSNVMMSSLSKKDLKKNAKIEAEYWISPDGHANPVDSEGGHDEWIMYNSDEIENSGVDTGKLYDLMHQDETRSVPYELVREVYNRMLLHGWVRIGGSTLASDPTSYVEVGDLQNIPSSIDTFIAENFSEGEILNISDTKKRLVKISNPFPSLQKAVNKALRQPVMASFGKFMRKHSALIKKAAEPGDLRPTVADDPEIRKHFADRGVDIVKFLNKFPVKITFAPKEAQSYFKMSNTFAAYVPERGAIYLNPDVQWGAAKSSLIHELEHVIQENAGLLPTGENLKRVMREIPYGMQPWEWSARFQQVRQLKNKGYSLDDVIKYFVEREHKTFDNKLDIPEETRDQLTTLYEMVDEVDPQSIVGSLSKSAIKRYYALYVGTSGYPAARTLTQWKAERILKRRFPKFLASGDYLIKEETYPDDVPIQVEASLSKQADKPTFWDTCVNVLKQPDCRISNASELQQIVEAGHPLSKNDFINLVQVDPRHKALINNKNTQFGYNDQKGTLAWAYDPNKDIHYFYASQRKSLNKKAHCGPCSIIKAEVIKMLADLKYKDGSISDEMLCRMAELSAEPSNAPFSDYLLNDVIEKLPKEHEKEIQKLKNHVLALIDIQKRIDEGDMVPDKPLSKKEAAKEVPTLSNKVVTDLIPMFVDKTDPSDHKCATCKFRIEKDGKATCAIMKGEINLEKGTCNYWAEGEASKEQNPSQMERKTAGYVEANIVNCGSCKHFKDKYCSLWNGKVKADQCCMAWEGATTKEGSLDKRGEIMEISIGRGPLFSVIVNPSAGEARGLLEQSQMRELRYTYDQDGACYLWDAYYGTHFDVKKELHELSFPIDEHAPDEFVMGERDLSVFGSLNKQANPPSRFWIAPDGEEFLVGSAGHGAWIKLHPDILKAHGIDTTEFQWTHEKMMQAGWVRVSNEPAGTGFVIEVKDLNNIPSFVDDFIAKYYHRGEKILIGAKSQFLEISNPFPSIQKAVSKALRGNKQASLDVSQETQNAIASQYGPEMLVALRFYNEAVGYGQPPDRALEYAVSEAKNTGKPVDAETLSQVLKTSF